MSDDVAELQRELRDGLSRAMREMDQAIESELERWVGSGGPSMLSHMELCIRPNGDRELRYQGKPVARFAFKTE